MTEEGDKKGVVWLNAWKDPVANLKAYSSHIDLADLNGDGDHKLVVADLDKKLKVFKGTSLVLEHTLLETPVALCCYYMDFAPPLAPVIAVAAGSHIYIYKNLKPFYKFTLPNPFVEPQEQVVWDDIRGDRVDPARAREALRLYKDKGYTLSTRSLDLLAVHEPSIMQEFVATYKNLPLVQQTVITCMTTLKKSRDDATGVSCLVVGTETGQVIILDPTANSILKKIFIRSPPAFIVAHGVFDVEYRFTVACRNGVVYTVKNGEVSGVTIELEVQPLGLVRIDKHIYVGCMDNSIHAYQVRGKKDFTLYMPCGITNLELLQSDTTTAKGLIVALNNGEIRVYHEKNLISTFTMSSPLTAVRFGHFGRESGTLLMVTDTGALDVRILSRNSTPLNATPPLNGPPPEQEIPLKVPKKTKLYIEQTVRERETAVDMHRVFQKELYKLRLSSARAYVKSLTDTQGPISYSVSANMRLSAMVQGLGPVFKLKLTIDNTGKRPIPDVTVTFLYNHALYKLKSQIINIPLIVPELSYKAETQVECMEGGGADPIRVFVCNSQSTVPILTAIINMPVAESFFSFNER